MQTNHVIGLVGPVRAGKTTACNYLRSNYNATVFRNSEILEEIIQLLSIEKNRANLSKIGLTLFDAFGRDVLARHWTKKFHIISGDAKLIVIDGLRFPEEITYYRENCHFKLLAVVAPEELRHYRSKNASDSYKDGLLDKRTFISQSTSATETCVASLVNDSDAVINNSKTLEEFWLELEKFASTLK